MSEFTLWDHQKLAIEKARIQNDLALLLPPGTGKTATTISILKEEFNKRKRYLPTLVTGPIITVRQWRSEILKFSKMPQERILALDKSGPSRLSDFKRAVDKFDGELIIITNYEAFLTSAFHEAVVEWNPRIVVYDESHRLKNPTSKRVKALRPIARNAERRFLLTGTPVLNSPMDLFSQYLLMDNGKTFGENFYGFRARYFYDKNAHMPRQKYFPHWVVRKDAIPEINKLLSETSVQARKEDCLKLPPLVEVDLPVTMGKEQEKAYRELEKNFITFVKDKAVTAELAITKTLRMRQCLTGFLLPDKEAGEERKPIFFEENPRLDALIEKTELLAESGGKVIIWTDFQATYEMIGKRLEKAGLKHVFLTGLESAKEKAENVHAFTLGDVTVAVCNPAAVGLGVNLTQAKYAIYYSRGYSLGELDQSKARNYRGGSDMHDSVTHYSIFVEKTIDEVIRKSLEGKASIADAVLAWGRAQS